MKHRRAIVLALVAVAALVVLFVKSQVRARADSSHLIDDARHLRELDSNLERAVLESEANLTFDYDAIDATQRKMEGVQGGIEAEIPPEDRELLAAAALTRAHIRESAGILERFKSTNSIARNSMAYIPMYAKRAAAGETAGEVVALVAAVLRCSVECGPTTARDLREAIDLLSAARTGIDGDRGASLDVLLRHARIVVDASPRVDATTRHLLDDGVREFDELHRIACERRETAIDAANVYRALLVAFSVALVLAVGLMILRLRRNAMALERTLETVEEQRRALSQLNDSLEERVEERTSELLASREQYRRLVETTQAVPWECVPDSVATQYLGPQITALLGYPLEVCANDVFLTSRVHEADLLRLREWLAELATTRRGDCEFRLRAANGRYVWIRSYGNAVDDAHGRVVRRGFLMDVSERRQLEADLRAAQKLESVGRLAAGVAHEINTPIQFVNDSVHFVRDSFNKLRSVLAAFVKLLDARETHGDALRIEARAAYDAADTEYVLANVPEALDSSVEGLHRIATIVKALKEFSHPDRKHKSPADLNANIRSTLTIAANEYKHVAEVVTDLGELPHVVCHAGEINQVLLNLVVNAAQAIGDVVGSSGERGRIELKSRREGGSVVITVKDTGGGIPTEIQERIFDPFFTTKEVGRGTGQGLAIARTIVVEKHGGDLTFDTEPGEGTEFTLRLPIAPTSKLDAAA